MKECVCWRCGERPAKLTKYGFPVCDECAEDSDGIVDDVEECVIDKFEIGDVIGKITTSNLFA